MSGEVLAYNKRLMTLMNMPLDKLMCLVNDIEGTSTITNAKLQDILSLLVTITRSKLEDNFIFSNDFKFLQSYDLKNLKAIKLNSKKNEIIYLKDFDKLSKLLYSFKYSWRFDQAQADPIHTSINISDIIDFVYFSYYQRMH